MASCCSLVCRQGTVCNTAPKLTESRLLRIRRWVVMVLVMLDAGQREVDVGRQYPDHISAWGRCILKNGLELLGCRWTSTVGALMLSVCRCSLRDLDIDILIAVRASHLDRVCIAQLILLLHVRGRLRRPLRTAIRPRHRFAPQQLRWSLPYYVSPDVFQCFHQQAPAAEHSSHDNQ